MRILADTATLAHVEPGTSGSERAGFTLGARHCIVLVFVALSLLLGVRTYGVATKSQHSVDIESIAIARDLTRGVRPADGVQTYERMPGFALLLLAFSSIDGGVALGLSCGADGRPACTSRLFHSMIALQYAGSVGIIIITAMLAWRLSRHHGVVLIILVLTAFTARLADWSGLVRPQIWYHLLLASYLLLGLCAYQRRSVMLAAAAGLTLGISCLFEPLTIVLVPVAAALVAREPAYSSIGKYSLWRSLGLVGGACAGVALAFVAVALSYDGSAVDRYIARHIAERTAFNGMGNGTWLASLVFPMPLVGDWLGAVMPDLSVALGIPHRPGSIVLDGSTAILQDAMGHERSLGAAHWIINEKIVTAPGAYAWATPAILLRGVLGGGGLIALVGLLHVPRMITYARVENRLGDLLVVLVPIVALFAVNTALTANGPWLNPMLVFVYVYSIAYVARGW